MDWLNYHHLYYFWVVAREGSVTQACERLYLAQPTVSGQIRKLERTLGYKLFTRAGRGLTMTETGRMVYRYAEEIFSLGRDLVETLEGRPGGRPVQFIVGVADVLPKLVAYRLLKPAIGLPDPVHLICREGPLESLVAELSIHALDLVLSDNPVSSQLRVRVFNHLLGECGISFFGKGPVAAGCRRRFPRCLDGAPFLMPASNTSLRRSLDAWFESQDIRPTVRAEFDDSALLKVFGQTGVGFFAAPTVIEEEVRRQYRVQVIGRVESLRERFYAISVERKLKHPAVVAISEAARRKLFG